VVGRVIVTVGAITEKDGQVYLAVRVQPKASREEIRFEADGRIRIALTAAPVDGEANNALKAFLSKRLGIPKRAIEVASGEKSREKRLVLEGITRKAVEACLRGRSKK
jgi:uncharacterized protein (TIGR00251 family)